MSKLWEHGPSFNIVIRLQAPDVSTGITRGRVTVLAGQIKMVTHGNVPKLNVASARFEVANKAARAQVLAGGLIANPFFNDHAHWYYDTNIAPHMLAASFAQGRKPFTTGVSGQVSEDTCPLELLFSYT